LVCADSLIAEVFGDEIYYGPIMHEEIVMDIRNFSGAG
jgi:hypothetical protein